MNPRTPDGDGSASVGRQTSGQQGATPSRETQRETGGSGGDALTANQVETETTPAEEQRPAEAGSAALSGARGAQDTRGEQGGATDTGLGTPETGANQKPEDLAGP